MEEGRSRQDVLGRRVEEHLFVEPELVRGQPPTRRGRRRRWGAKKSSTPKRVLIEEADLVYKASLQKGKIVPDPSMYFVITFSDTFRSPIIRKIVQDLKLDLVEVTGDNVAKVRIPKIDYESFLENLERKADYVDGIRESTLREKIEESLLAVMTAEPDRRVRVNIEISRIGDRALIDNLLDALREYISSGNFGKIERAYLSDRLLLLTGELAAKSVREIAEDVDAISRINLASVIRLHSRSLFLTSMNEGRVSRVRIRSLLPTPAPPEAEDLRATKLPTVCIIDTGLNQDHDCIKPYVVDTYDLTVGSQMPCNDSLGHGTMVAGMAIYEGDVPSLQVKSSVIAVKAFDEPSFQGNIMKYISETVQRFKDKSRVFNLSFASDGPDPALSRALDDLSLRESVLFVTCTGNIDREQIIDELRRGSGYPDYLTNHVVFFPGDCYNVLTVGSFTQKDSNFVQQQRPSPFTRTYPFPSKVKPEVLATGGNMNLERQNNDITGCNSNGCGIVSTSNIDSEYREDCGTSFSCPVISSIVAGLAGKFQGRPTCLYKALIASSCQQLTDESKRPFETSVQGFGIPSREYAMYSNFWRVNLCADSVFDLQERRHRHRYRFLFPDNATSIRITLCFEVEPSSSLGLPYDVLLKLHKPGTQFRTSVQPDHVVTKDESNLKQYEFQVYRGGKGMWTVDLYPKVKPSFLADPAAEKLLRYAVVITIISDKKRDIYRSIKTFLKRVR